MLVGVPKEIKDNEFRVGLVPSTVRELTDKGYWYNLPKSAGFPFLALVEHTHFIPREHYGGDHLLYCGDYLTGNRAAEPIRWALDNPARQTSAVVERRVRV